MPIGLEVDMLPQERWPEAPPHMQYLVERETRDGVPTGIGWNTSLGYFVIQSSGQGPYLIAQERHTDERLTSASCCCQTCIEQARRALAMEEL